MQHIMANKNRRNVKNFCKTNKRETKLISTTVTATDVFGVCAYDEHTAAHRASLYNLVAQITQHRCYLIICVTLFLWYSIHIYIQEQVHSNQQKQHQYRTLQRKRCMRSSVFISVKCTCRSIILLITEIICACVCLQRYVYKE